MFHLFSFCGKLKPEGGFFTLETIGNKIRFLRKVANESQEELAKAANVSRISIGNYERNTRTPDPETLRLIADHYGVSLIISLAAKILKLNSCLYPTIHRI